MTSALSHGNRTTAAAVQSKTVADQDAAPVETCLREWRTTARALADPQRRAILTGPGDDDYAEVSRPQEE